MFDIYCISLMRYVLYCSDSCKFLHDRGDYKHGWQLEREEAKSHDAEGIKTCSILVLTENNLLVMTNRLCPVTNIYIYI